MYWARAAVLTSFIMSAVTFPTYVSADPPPHAPAHGYRYKHAQGVDLAFNSEFGVYVVAGLPSYFYHAGKFYRQAQAGWEVSAKIGGGSWSIVATSSLPVRLHLHKFRPHKGVHPGPAKARHKNKH